MNSWTQILTPTELEKTFKLIGRTEARTVQITRPDGTTQTFKSAYQAAKNTGIKHTTIAKRCRNRYTDEQGNRYRYI